MRFILETWRYLTFIVYPISQIKFSRELIIKNDDVIKWKHFPREFPSQRPMTQSFGVFSDLRLNKRLGNNRDAGDLRHTHTYTRICKLKCKVAYNSVKHINPKLGINMKLIFTIDATCKIEHNSSHIHYIYKGAMYQNIWALNTHMTSEQ